jgi:hypothetical protein
MAALPINPGIRALAILGTIRISNSSGRAGRDETSRLCEM